VGADLTYAWFPVNERPTVNVSASGEGINFLGAFAEDGETLFLECTGSFTKEVTVQFLQDNCSDDDVEPSSLLPRERWAKAFGRRDERILRRVARRLGFEPPSLVESLTTDALNPNAHHTSLLDGVQHDPFDADLAQSSEISLDSRRWVAALLVYGASIQHSPFCERS